MEKGGISGQKEQWAEILPKSIESGVVLRVLWSRRPVVSRWRRFVVLLYVQYTPVMSVTEKRRSVAGSLRKVDQGSLRGRGDEADGTTDACSDTDRSKATTLKGVPGQKFRGARRC
jgi:hypothetical protein